MSIDFKLNKLDGDTNISEEELTNKLGVEYEVSEVQQDESGNVISFVLIDTFEGQKNKLEFHKQPDTSFWTYTYDYSGPAFTAFTQNVALVATLLDWRIGDPQTGNENMTAEEFLAGNSKMDEVAQTQQDVIDKLPEILDQIDFDSLPQSE